MTALTERRKADRATMAAEVAGLAELYGLSAEIGPPPLRAERATEVRISGPHTLAVRVTFDGNSPHSEPDTYVLSWHMRPWDAEGKGWTLCPGAFGNVNPYTGTKATDVAHSFDHLRRLLTRRFAAIADGSAFEQEAPEPGFYQISSKTGMRHRVAGPMPANDAALAMWQGRDLPTTLCGRTLQPVNFYQPGEKSLPRYTCQPCVRSGQS